MLAAQMLKSELNTPALLVDLSVMERNIERMAQTFRDAGVGWLHDELYAIRDARVEAVWPVLGRGKFR
jgi:D-serine deaminase-like pyridoxal phosphate-dependent protein